MHSKVMSLLWERWKITRWTLMLACLFPLLGRLMYLAGFNTLEGSVVASKITWFIGFSYLTGMLLIGHCDAQDIKLSFPERLFRYPFRTSTFIAVYMGYGVAAIAVQAFIFFGFEVLFFDSVNFKWSYFLILETTFIIFQTIAWLSWLPGAIPHLLLCLLSSSSLCFSLYLLFVDTNLSTGITISCLIMILICCGISLPGVSGLRHNSYNPNRKWSERFYNIFQTKQKGSFSSPLEAQIWFESKQTGYLFPFTFLCTIIPVLAFILIVNIVTCIRFEDYTFPAVSNVITFLMPLAMIAALLAGMFAVAVYNRNQNPGTSSFNLRFPLSTREMAAARFHSVVKSMVIVSMMIILLSAGLIIFDWYSGNLNIKAVSPVKWALKYDSSLEIITMTVLGLYAYILYCWVLLCMSIEILLVAGITAIVIWIIKFFTGDIAVEYVLNVLFAAVPVYLVTVFYKAKQKNLITTTSVLISALIFPLAILSLWAYPWYYTVAGLPRGLPDLALSESMYIIAGAAIPLIPIAFTPLLMHKLRHR